MQTFQARPLPPPPPGFARASLRPAAVDGPPPDAPPIVWTLPPVVRSASYDGRVCRVTVATDHNRFDLWTWAWPGWEFVGTTYFFKGGTNEVTVAIPLVGTRNAYVSLDGKKTGAGPLVVRP